MSPEEAEIPVLYGKNRIFLYLVIFKCICSFVCATSENTGYGGSVTFS